MTKLFFNHGGYRNLRSFQTATLIYDLTVYFCDHFVEKGSRTKDQMVQAARSGRQNIAEGSQAAGTSRETELKLVNVARASLEELLLDYEDYLRQHKLPLWDKNSPQALAMRARRARDLSDLSDLTDQSDPGKLANAAICLVNQANFLLDRQLAAIGGQFVKDGGFRERLTKVRRGLICLISLMIGPICLISLIRPIPALAVNSGNFTMSLWVNPTTSVANKALVGKAEELRMFTNASGQPGCQIKTTTWQTAVGSSTAISVGSWSHVICTYDLVNLKIYVNGVLKGTQALTSLPDDTANVLRIGQDDSASTTYINLAGTVDEFKFYPYALTSDEVLTEYNHGSNLVFGSLSDTSGVSGGTKTDNSASAQYCIPGDTATCTAPVAEWNFNEGSGTSVADSSGNSNTGTWYGTGNHWNSAGKIGSAGKFNGTSDSVVPSSNPAPNDSSWTISAWVKPSVLNYGETIIAASIGYDIGLKGRASSLICAEHFSSGTTLKQICTTVTSTTQWHYYSAVFSGNSTTGTLYFYLDGVSQGSIVVNSPRSNSNFGIGGWYQSGTSYRNFPGSIDQVRIFNYARTAAQVAWDYNRGAPIARYKMDECSGTVIHDSSGNNNTGTLTNATPGTCDDGTSTTAWGGGKTGKFNASLKFDGVDDFVNIPDPGTNSIFDFTTAMTASAWVYLNSAGNYPSVITKGNTSPNWGWDFEFNSNTRKIELYMAGPNGDWLKPATTAVPLNTWTHIVATYDGTNIKYYYNGQPDGSYAATTNILTNDVAVMIGGRADGASIYFPGQIDDVQIYNYALTAAQIKLLYNQNSAVRFGP